MPMIVMRVVEDPREEHNEDASRRDMTRLTPKVLVMRKDKDNPDSRLLLFYNSGQREVTFHFRRGGDAFEEPVRGEMVVAPKAYQLLTIKGTLNLRPGEVYDVEFLTTPHAPRHVPSDHGEIHIES